MDKILPVIILESVGNNAEEFAARVMQNKLAAYAMYHSLVTDSLISRFPELASASEIANFVMENLFYWQDYSTSTNCLCCCHPTLPNSDLHGFGFECPCMHDGARGELLNPDPTKPNARALDLESALKDILQPVVH